MPCRSVRTFSRQNGGVFPRTRKAASASVPAALATTGGSSWTRRRTPEISATISSASSDVIAAPLIT